jgi:hypothetical protein
MISIKFENLNTLADTFTKVQADTIKGIGIGMQQIQKALQQDITGLYHFSPLDFNRSLEQQQITVGTNSVTGEITYRNIHKNLAEFPYSSELGNIPPLPKQKQGQVHSVSVRRGKVKVVYGKHGRGGFTRENGTYGMQMFERITKARYPLRLVFGPSVVDTIKWGWNRPQMLPTVTKVIDNLPYTIAMNINV